MKKIIAIVLLITMVLSFAGVAEAKENVEIHVSVNGNDISGKGTVQKPYATLQGAKDAVKKLLNENASAPIDVIFHEGTYRFTKSVDFKIADSGTEKAPVTYKGAEGEKVIFKGSVKLDATKIKLVQDMKILEKLPVEARGKVGYIDLKEQGITSVPQAYYYSMHDAKKFNTYSALYLNDKEQPIAQWPNGLNVYSAYSRAVAVGGSGETGAGAVIELKDYRLKRWINAKDAWVDIFGGNDYQKDTIPVKYVNPQEKTITFGAGSTQGMTSSKSKRYKIWNLIEELDRPGEWYIDRNELKLYYYPEPKLADKTMELTIMEGNLVNIDTASNITFENITFAQVKGRAFKLNGKCENLTFDNCIFENIGETAIWSFNNKRGTLGQTTTQGADFFDDGLMKFTVKNCSFKDIGHYAMYLRPLGSASELINSESIIENNYFTNINAKRGTGACVNTWGNGLEFRNNLMHNTHDGINFTGVDVNVYNNEAYNMHKYSSDAGVFYTGRNYITRGSSIYNNFSKDVSTIDPHMNTNYNRFVYLDDAQAGITVRNNIFIGKAYGGICINGGQDNHVYDNILIDNEQALLINAWTSGDQARIEREIGLATDALNNEHWSRFHDVIREGITEKYLGKAALNTVYNNVMINGIADIAKEQIENSDIHDNITVTEDVFVDAQNGDYRIKDAELLAKYPNLPSETNYDYKDIGIKVESFKNNPIQQESFRLLYPENGAIGVDSKEVNFTWQKSTGADGYRFILATDAKLENRIIDEIVYETAYSTDKIKDNNTSYYWKVYAYNNSLHFAGEWASYGVPYNFVTSKNFSYDTTELEATVMAGKKRAESAVEGENVGEYVKGYKQRLTEKCAYGEKFLNKTITLNETAIENLIKEINDLLNNDVYIKGGYLNISDMIADKDSWDLSGSQDRVEFTEEGNIVMKKGAKAANFGCNKYNEASSKIVVTFKLKPDFGAGGGGDYLAFGMRGKTGQHVYNSGNDQYFILFKDGLLEYQKNTNGSSKVLATIHDERIKSGEWMDIEFGVLDLNLLGVLTIIKFNGEVLYQEIDTEDNRVTTKGALGFMATQNVTMEIAPGAEKTGGIDDIIEEYTLLMTKKYCERIEKEVGNSTVVMQVGSNKGYVDNTLVDVDEKLTEINGNVFMSVNTSNKMLKTNAYVSGNEIYVTYRGNNFKFTNGSNIYTVNGAQKNLGFNVENNMIPVKEMVTDSDMTYFCYDKKMVMIMETSIMNYANYDSLLNGASKSLGLYQ